MSREVIHVARDHGDAVVHVTSAESPGPSLVATWQGPDRPPQEFRVWTTPDSGIQTDYSLATH